MEPLLLNHCANRAQQNDQVQFQAPVVAVFLVQFHLAQQGNTVTPVDLGPAGEPGRKRYTPYSSRSRWARISLEISGRGPTKLISPLRIFHSWGNSSRLVLRRNLPNFVSTVPGSPNSAGGTVGGVVLHGLELVNGKGLAPPSPPLMTKEHRALRVNRFTIQITKNSGDSTTSAKKEAQISKQPLDLGGTKPLFFAFSIHKIRSHFVIKIRAATGEKTPRCATWSIFICRLYHICFQYAIFALKFPFSTFAGV